MLSSSIFFFSSLKIMLPSFTLSIYLMFVVFTNVPTNRFPIVETSFPFGPSNLCTHLSALKTGTP